MTPTPNLALDPLASAQAQKHVTVNEAFARIDAATQLAVIDRDLVDPPASPSDGDRYLLPASPTGAWSGRGGDVAAWEAATLGWLFLTPRPGWRLWVLDEDVLLVLTGTGWQQAGGGGAADLNPVSGGLLGVNTTADPVNRLAVKTDAALFSHDDVTPGTGDMRFTLNKAAPGKDASLTLQNAYSTRAQIGLTGDDDLRFKTSPDGIAFNEALALSAADGSATFANGLRMGGSGTRLDAYEEGVWTPTLIGLSGGVATTSVAAGIYVRVGSLVFCSLRLVATDHTALAGTIAIDGLPFLVRVSPGVPNRFTAFAGFWSGITLPPGSTVLMGFGQDDDRIRLTAPSTTTGAVYLTDTALTDPSVTIYMSFTYQAV